MTSTQRTGWILIGVGALLLVATLGLVTSPVRTDGLRCGSAVDPESSSALARQDLDALATAIGSGSADPCGDAIGRRRTWSAVTGALGVLLATAGWLFLRRGSADLEAGIARPREAGHRSEPAEPTEPAEPAEPTQPTADEPPAADGRSLTNGPDEAAADRGAAEPPT